MRCIVLTFLLLFAGACHQSNQKKQQSLLHLTVQYDSLHAKSYTEIKKDIASKREQFSIKYPILTDSAQKEISDYWVKTICEDLCSKWQNTPWDFNGTTTEPQQGAIACGYFVTTILKDMGVSINRIKLATCASSEMMKSLTPLQKIKNLSYLSYPGFNDTLKALGNNRLGFSYRLHR